MLTINLVCVGNLKEQYWIDACKEYQKRLSRFCKLNIIEIAEKNQFEKALTLNKEGQDIISHLAGYSILLAIEGKQFTSEEFASKLQDKTQSVSTITFVIGGSYGVSDSVKSVVNEKISFGKPTYPHNLARVMILEQIYRAFMINSGSSFHK